MRAALILLLILGSNAEARNGYLYAERPEAKSGSCISAHDEDSHTILQRNGIRMNGNFESKEIQALALGIAQLERLNGGPIPHDWRTPFHYHNASGAWNQAADRINVRKMSYGGDNVGALMHELGHKIANAAGRKITNEYLAATKPCRLSPYASSNRLEEIAEVFSALIVNPDDLKSKCPDAHAYFTTKVLKNGEKTAMASCGAQPTTTEVGAATNAGR